jgi:hypothetical protein
LRTSLPDGYFHVTTRGVDSCAIFRDDYDRLVFLSLYRERVERHGWETHVHDRTGHLFGDRFSSRVIAEEDYLDVACR